MKIEKQIVKTFLMQAADGTYTQSPTDMRLPMLRVIEDTELFILRANPCSVHIAEAALDLLVSAVTNLAPSEIVSMIGSTNAPTRIYTLNDNGKIVRVS